MKCSNSACERETDRPQGICFACHVGSVSFGFRGGGSYGRSAFNRCTNKEMVDDAKANAALQGREIEPKHSKAWFV